MSTSNVIEPRFTPNHLRRLAEDILNCIYEMSAERNLTVPETLGVLELVKQQLIDDAKSEELDGDEY